MDSTGIKYSMPLRGMWRKFRLWSKEMQSNDFNAFYYKFYQFALTRTDLKVRDSALLLLDFWKKDFNGEFLHVWFEQKELYNYLHNVVELKDLIGIKQYLAVNGNHLKEKSIEDPTIPFNYVRYDIALHVPNLEEGYVFSFCLLDDNSIVLFFADDEGSGQIRENEYNYVKSRKDDDSLVVERNFRLAVNLLAYMECFPECVRDGVPTIHNDTVYQPKGKNIRLSVSEKVLECTQKGVKCPHMRKGYFKYLSSEFYKSKRGQIIFVRETMVKSKSKTVEMSDNEKKVEKFKNT